MASQCLLGLLQAGTNVVYLWPGFVTAELASLQDGSIGAWTIVVMDLDG